MQLSAPEASTVQDAQARKALWAFSAMDMAFSGMDMGFIGTDMAPGASTPMPGVMPGVMPGDAAGKGTRLCVPSGVRRLAFDVEPHPREAIMATISKPLGVSRGQN